MPDIFARKTQRFFRLPNASIGLPPESRPVAVNSITLVAFLPGFFRHMVFLQTSARYSALSRCPSARATASQSICRLLVFPRFLTAFAVISLVDATMQDSGICKSFPAGCWVFQCPAIQPEQASFCSITECLLGQNGRDWQQLAFQIGQECSQEGAYTKQLALACICVGSTPDPALNSAPLISSKSSLFAITTRSSLNFS